MKKNIKNDLRKMSHSQLMKHLQDLETEKMKAEVWMYTKNGSSMLVRNYPAVHQENNFANLKRIKKDIARVKTFLHLKFHHRR